MKYFLFALLISACFHPGAFATDTVVLATLDWGPYIGRALPENGYVAAVAREAFARNGYDIDLKFNKWTRSVGLAKRGEVDGYLPEYYADNILEYATFSLPFPGGPIGFFKMKKDTVQFNSLEDLIGYRIGVVKGYVNTREFDTADFLDKDSVADDLANFKKLIAGRIDLVVADKFVGFHILHGAMPEEAPKIEFMENTLGTNRLYICISKQSENHGALLEAVNKGLAEMGRDGSIDRLLKKFGLHVH